MLREIAGILLVASVVAIFSAVSAKRGQIAESLWAVAAMTVITLGIYFFCIVYDMYRVTSDQVMGALAFGLIIAGLCLHYARSRKWKMITGSVACGIIVAHGFIAVCAQPWR